jgi:hypothetical protein
VHAHDLIPKQKSTACKPFKWPAGGVFLAALIKSAVYGRINQFIKQYFAEETGMSKAGKIIWIIVVAAVALVIGAWLLIGALWSGAFNFMLPSEIATYQSPDKAYSLVFEQMGDPAWPFGPTDVRLTLKNPDGKIMDRLSTQVFNDGVSADEYNVASISWNDDAVIVVLRACEMEDKEVSISYNKN